MKLVNGSDTKKVYSGKPIELGFELGLFELLNGCPWVNSIQTQEGIDSDKDIKEIYDLLEWLGFNVNDHEFVNGEGYIICAVPSTFEGYPDPIAMKRIQENILLYLCDKVSDKEYYAIARDIRYQISEYSDMFCD